MILIRPARLGDVDRLFELASSIEGGMTTLPADRDALAEKVHQSHDGLCKAIEEPGAESYLFVFVDMETNRVGGTAALYAGIGLDKPFYSYKITKTTHVSSEPKIHKTHDILHLVNDYVGHTEVGTLYLAPEFRAHGNGRCLARSRYVFIAAHRNRFPQNVMAEMRGWQDASGHSPFWRALGKNFFDMTFHQADHLNAVSNNQFIADLMPKSPIYVDLLPEEAQAVIGKPHEHAAPALAMLKSEGFRYERHVDIFDAGPCVEAAIDDVVAVKNTAVAQVSAVRAALPQTGDYLGEALIAAGEAEHFRLTRAGLVRLSNGEVDIDREAAELLNIEPGSQVHYVSVR